MILWLCYLNEGLWIPEMENEESICCTLRFSESFEPLSLVLPIQRKSCPIWSNSPVHSTLINLLHTWKQIYTALNIYQCHAGYLPCVIENLSHSLFSTSNFLHFFFAHSEALTHWHTNAGPLKLKQLLRKAAKGDYEQQMNACLLILLFFHEQRPGKLDSGATGSHNLIKTACLEIQDDWLIFDYVIKALQAIQTLYPATVLTFVVAHVLA